MLQGITAGQGSLAALAAMCKAKTPVEDYLRNNVFCNQKIKVYETTVDSSAGVDAIYIYLCPLKNSIRHITTQIDVNDGTVWVGILDVDKNNMPVGLEIILNG